MHDGGRKVIAQGCTSELGTAFGCQTINFLFQQKAYEVVFRF